jgi:LysM repeat protein
MKRTSLGLMLTAFLAIAASGFGQSAELIFGDQNDNDASQQIVLVSEAPQERVLDPVYKEFDSILKDLQSILKELGDLLEGRINKPKPTTPAPTTTTPPRTTTPAPAATSSARTYTVVRGDSLSKIAQKLLGNGNRWPELVTLNKDRYPSLLKNPNLIHPGWVLRIPGGSSSGTTPPATGTPPSTSTPPASSGVESAALQNWRGGRLAPSEFIRLLAPVAQASSRQSGIPVSIILAQAALETGWGGSTIGDAKNLFGIKGTGPAGSIRVPTREFRNGQYVTEYANFRKYHTWQQSIDDHGRLLTTASRYAPCMANRNNPDQFARELQRAGYATSPTYAQTLISIMRTHNMYQYNL